MSEEPLDLIGSITKAIQNCSWFFFTALVSPSSFGAAEAPSPDEAGLFIAGVAAVIAVFIRVMESASPIFVQWNTNDGAVSISTLKEWADLQNGYGALPRIAPWAAWFALWLVLSALGMTLLLLLIRWRRPARVEFTDTTKRACVVVGTSIMLLLLSEGALTKVASTSLPGWVIVASMLLMFAFQGYLLLILPWRVWRSNLRMGRLRTGSAVLLSWVVAMMATGLVEANFFAPETSIDSLLAAQLRKMASVGSEGKYREASDLAMELQKTHADSVQLDAMTISLLSRAFIRSRDRNQDLSRIPDDLQWATDAAARYRDLSDTTDRLQRKYSDDPGMLLRIARAQLESGQCAKAQLVFDAVYHHRHATISEQVFAGLYLRSMDREPDDFEPLLARFDPSGGWSFLRMLMASPGLGIEMFYYDFDVASKRFDEMHNYAEQLASKHLTWECNIAPRQASAPSLPLRN
jgi:hypothetical protein